MGVEMPDIGGLGRGLLKGALSATEKAADKVKDAAEAASRKIDDDTQPVKPDPDATQVVAADPEVTQVAGTAPTEPAADKPAATESAADEPAVDDDPEGADDPEERADDSDVSEVVEVFRRLLAEHRPPPGQLYDGWSMGVGDVLASLPKVPKRVRGLIRKLNRFGGVSLSPQEIVLDGDDVPWEKVTEVRTRHLVGYLVGDAVQQQVEGLPMPPFPGRRRLLDALGQALLTLTIATAEEQLDKVDFFIPAEIVYKASFGRRKELNAGFISALILAEPAVIEALIATAKARGITVTPADDDMVATAEERAAQIREKITALQGELDKFKQRFSRSG
jgi:hypothetical protein